MANQPLNDAVILEVGRLFGALGDTSRLKILRALLDSGDALSQGAVAEAAGLSQANASKHLAHLVQVGLVLREPHGIAVHFRPVVPLVQDVCNLMGGYVRQRIQTAYQSLT